MRLAFSWQAPLSPGILLLIVPVSWLGFLIIGVLLAAFEIYLQRIKPPRPMKHRPPPVPATRRDSRLTSAKPRQKSSKSPVS
jgi:hypothetical protein